MCEAGEKSRHARSQEPEVHQLWLELPTALAGCCQGRGCGAPFPAGCFPRLLCQPRQLLRAPVTGRLDIRWGTLLSLEQTFLYKASPSGALLPPDFLTLTLSYSLSLAAVRGDGSGREMQRQARQGL